MYVRARERECVCVCERERERESVCEYTRERESVLCVCEWGRGGRTVGDGCRLADR